MTADASHELRSPLTALRAVGEVALRDGNDPAALRDTIGSMLEEAQRLNDLVDADRLLLRQALMNIVHNAIRYSPAETRITLSARRDRGVIIEVADEGSGIALEHRERIFERFYRTDKARTRAEGGAGLGLAIAKQAVERNGGRIELENASGLGNVFRVTLPSINSQTPIGPAR